MRRLGTFLLFLVMVFAFAAFAHEVPVGVIVSAGTSVNNTSTATKFTLVPGNVYALQCDAAACVRAGSGSSSAVSCTKGGATTGVKVTADQLYDVPMKEIGTDAVDTIAIIPVSGSANCQVFRVVTL